MTDRLPTALEVSALLRQVNAAGGFAMVLRKGEPDAGAILLIIVENGRNPRAYERMPSLDGPRQWHLSRDDDATRPQAFGEWVERRQTQDSDLWVIELDIANGERFIGFDAQT